MMMKASWIVIGEKIGGKYFYHAERLNHSNEVLHGVKHLASTGGKYIDSIWLADSKRDALQIAKDWNDAAKRNGNYHFDMTA